MLHRQYYSKEALFSLAHLLRAPSNWFFYVLPLKWYILNERIAISSTIIIIVVYQFDSHFYDIIWGKIIEWYERAEVKSI